MSNIHKFELDGDYIVIDPASGAVHVADRQAYELLDKVKPAIFDRYEGLPGGCYSELYGLYKAGLLFSTDDCRQYAAGAGGTESTAYQNPPLKALCLQVSHDCNLRCGYCFAHNAVDERAVMTPETAIAAIDFLVAHSGERVELEADFFGGEPLMAWDAVTAAVDYARANEQKWEKRFRFTITTNGLLLDEDKIAYINAQMSNCVLSLDGRKAVNDKMRPTANGKGSFDLIIDKFKRLVAGRVKPDFTDWYLRGTFTAHNLDFAEDVLEMARLGFRNISLEPVTAPPAGNSVPDYVITHRHIPLIYQQYERLYRLIKSGELKVDFFHFNVDLSGGPCVLRRLRGCGSGSEYLAITPSGGVYPCHRFAGMEEWRMGDITRLENASIKQYFAETHIYSKSDCSECWARFYCSGGCNASSYESNGDCRITDGESVECLMMKKRLECGIALNALGANL